MIESVEDDLASEISIFDIISLYPFCNYKGPYPIGHPINIVPDNKIVDWQQPEDMQYDYIHLKGLIKCHVIPPPSLYFPILPMRLPEEKRLVFPLCKKCALFFSKSNNNVIEQHLHSCQHTDDQRSFSTTTTHIELAAALERGYKVTRLYRALHYEKWALEENSLFKNYVLQFLKIKIESSPFPSGLERDEQK